MTPNSIPRDAHAILLMCSSLGLPRGKAAEVTPLNQEEWNDLARRIAESELKRPGALLECESHSVREILKLPDAFAERLQQLLARGGPLAIELERLSSLGISILTRADDSYPKRLKQLLGGKAPSILFVAGDQSLLSREGLAIVGSRDVDEAGARFADAVGQKCAEAGLTVISGAAKGVDRHSMTGALESGGTAVGVLADSLEKSLTARETRRFVIEGQLLLLTPHHPQARFTVGTAMRRNKLVYALARYALVIASARENGGTWTGAMENLKAGWVSLFVRMGPHIPAGNIDLLRRGGLEFPENLLASAENLKQWLEEHARAPRVYAVSSGLRAEPQYTPAVTAGRSLSLDQLIRTGGMCDLFPLVWPYLAAVLPESQNENDIANRLSLELKQVKVWLGRALREGLVRKKTRPVRYELVRPQPAVSGVQDSLFDP